MKAPLLTLLTCLYLNLAIATTQPPVETGSTTSTEATIVSDSVETISISDEEKHYIDTECKRFANDDAITADDLPDYLALCNYELTIAVQAALLERSAKKKRQADVIKENGRAANQPKPM